MKTLLIYVCLLIAISLQSLKAKKRNQIDYLTHLPNDLKLDNTVERSYQITTDYYDYKLLGDFVGKRRFTGIITCGLEGDSAKWEDVYHAESKNFDAPFPKGEQQHFLQNYKFILDEKAVTSKFIEDEKPAANKLIRLLKEVKPNIKVIAILQSVKQATNWFSVNPEPALIFMDIQLDDGICFDIFDTHKIQAPIIFTTAYDKYSLKAFKVNSVDYLLKPINSEELSTAISKFESIHNQKIDYQAIESIMKLVQPKLKERFLVKVGERFKSIQTSSIYCFYISERFNFIFTNMGKNYAIDHSLDKIEQLVDQSLFFRINRNYIIAYTAINHIIVYSTNRLKINIYG